MNRNAGRIIRCALALMLAGWAGANARAAGGPDADLIYNPETGSVLLDAADTPTGLLIGFDLISSSGNMVPPPTGRLPFRLSCAECAPTSEVISQFDFSLKGTPWVWLGPILPKGLSQDELSTFFASAGYSYQIGGGGQFDLLIVPEPHGAVAAATCLALIAASRRAMPSGRHRRGTC